MKVGKIGLVGLAVAVIGPLFTVGMALAQTAPEFEDVPEGHVAEIAIGWAAANGVTTGVGNDQFGMGQTLTRYQMVTFLCRAFDPDACGGGTEGSDKFTDVPTDHWANYAIGWAVNQGIASGINAVEFGGSQTLTREQTVTFLYRAEGSPSGGSIGSDIYNDVPTDRDHWANLPIGWAYNQGITGGTATNIFGYGATLSREETVLFLCRAVAPDTCTPAPFTGIGVAGDYGAGPQIDTWDRSAVLREYSVEFHRSEPDPGFTGNISDCVAGTTSQEFRDHVVRRVNWYRRMAGLGVVTERIEYSEQAQQAALMMSAEGSLSHHPGRDWACYTSAGAAAAGSSNLALGNGGTQAIDAYMEDYGSNNSSVGHRRWILYPQLLEIGLGDVPGNRWQQGGWSANALYVLSAGIRDARPEVRELRGFVAWPPPGYVPAETVWDRWSFSLPADYSHANVTMADEHGQVPVVIIDSESYYGEEAVVWAVDGDTNSNRLSAPTNGDHCYQVAISDVRIRGITQPPYEYATCLLDP